MLLHVDGLNEKWDTTRMPTSDYEGRFGELEFDDLPLAMQRLYSPEEMRQYDTSMLSSSSQGNRADDGSGREDHLSMGDVREV